MSTVTVITMTTSITAIMTMATSVGLSPTLGWAVLRVGATLSSFVRRAAFPAI